MRLFATVLIVSGAMALVYQGIRFTVPKDRADLGIFGITVSGDALGSVAADRWRSGIGPSRRSAFLKGHQHLGGGGW